LLIIKGSQLRFAGAGTEQMQGYINAIKKHSDSIYVCMGRQPSVNEFMSNISVYVQPSVTEGFGIPTLEAMANGRVVYKYPKVLGQAI